MKVYEDEKADRYGVYPVCLVSGRDATPQKIYEWLFTHGYSGYKFAIVFDCMGSEFEELEKKTPVYFLDTIMDEILEYCGVEAVEGWLKKKRSART